ncbi:MAG: universal stress protein [Desulfobacteraceae bacterium]
MPESTILAAVANSDTGWHAGREAVKTSFALRGRLVVVSVVPAYCGNMDLLHIRNPNKTFSSPHEEVLAGIKKEAESAAIVVKTILEQGEPYERIVDVAEAERADMVVIGSGRRSLIERSILGSTAARVVGYCSCDVMVVPLGTSVDFKSILAAVDGSIYSRNAAIKAVQIAKDFGSIMQVLNVIDVPPEYYLHESIMEAMVAKSRRELETIRESSAEKGVVPDVIVKHGEAYRTIVDTARDCRSDLIIMGSHGRSGIRRLLMGSVVERVLAHAPCPVLVTHP